MRRFIPIVFGSLCVGPLLAGCINWQPAAKKPTMGRELMDLKAARDGGALTAEEYERQKLAIMQRDTDAPLIATQPLPTTTR